jgi:GntR family transcriptional regulator
MMLIVVDPHSGVPVYRQLMDQIKFHIASGLLKPGDDLPSTRKLSAELGVNPMTISKAYSYLEREGAVERRPGRKLAVRTLEDDAILEGKMEQLAKHLGPMVTMVRQLGLSDEDALKVFGIVLRGEAGEHEAGDCEDHHGRS